MKNSTSFRIMVIIRKAINAILSPNGVSRIKYFLYGGSKQKHSFSHFYCPICKNYFRKARVWYVDTLYFNLEHYKETNLRVVCPVCKSLPRHRILISWMEKNKDFIKKQRILYFAPEECVLRWLTENRIHVTTADLYEASDLMIDIQETQLKEGEYNFIVANHVLEHVQDYKKAFKEMYRILPVGGIFVCSFPYLEDMEHTLEDNSAVTSEDKKRVFGQIDHNRIFGKDIKKEMEKIGFSVSEVHGNDMSDIISPLVGPAKYDANIFFICKK